MPILIKKILEEYKNSKAKSSKLEGEKLYILIYKMLSRMIIKTEIPDNYILPATRTLAIELGVSRSTILRAYDILILDGLIVSKKNSGYRVNSKQAKEIKQKPENELDYHQLSNIGKSFLELSKHTVSNSGENLAFSPGLPPLDIFPVSQWKNLTNMYWKEIKFSNLTYSPSSGVEKLKINIAKYLNITRNIQCNPDQLIIVSGSMQSMYLLGSILLNPNENVFLENPTFPNVNAVFKGLIANIIGIPVDQNGISVEYMKGLKRKSKLIHVTPSSHYPSGVRMTLSRREELLEYANQNKSFIIENDYEHELNNWDSSLPSLFSLDKNQRTIYLGTFNRILHPSLRIGYMLIPHYLKLPLESMLKHSHRFVAPSIQFVLNQFIEKKVLHEHLKNLIQVTKERKLFFHQQFKEIFKEYDLSITPNDTLGLQSLIRLSTSQPDQDLVNLLSEHNISAHSYNKCFVNESQEQGLIVGHCSIPKPIIKNKLTRIHSLLPLELKK